MASKKKIAVVGLFRSGSSALAGVLHHLGVKMGTKYWGNHYEDAELAAQLRKYWNEPALSRTKNPLKLESILRQTIDRLSLFPENAIGAKHPLLSLSCPELVSSWGAETIIVRSCRNVEASVKSLQRAGWGGPDPRGLQRKLYSALEEFGATRNMVHCDYAQMLQDPRRTIESLVAQLNLRCKEQQFESAVDSILRHPSSRG